MKQIRFDSVLLFALLIPFIMTYRLSWDTTPFWLFGLIFLGLFSYACLDITPLPIKDTIVNKIKLFLLWFLIFATIGTGYLSAIIVRHQTSPIYNVHDIIVQQEAAIRFFLHGINPYVTTYFNTPLLQWHYSDTAVNPALYHFVMEPFYLLFPIPFYLVMGHTVGFFDARVPLFVLFIGLLIMAQYLVKDSDKKRTFLVLLAFNPANLGYFLEGRDDIFMLAFLFGSLCLLHKKKYLFSGIIMALAFATKQSVWPIFPFYTYFLYLSMREKGAVKDAIVVTIKNLLPFAIAFAFLVLPFFLWNGKAFLDSTIFYLSGNTAHSYPVAGYGFGMLLNELNIIKDVQAYYPFWIWQAIICLPLLAYFLMLLRKNNSIRNLILLYTIFLFVFWYFARYFNNSHLGFLSMLLIIAYFWPEEKDKEQSKNRGS